MRIATYNVNSVNARLPVLLRWLSDTQPDIACLQELKAPQDKFPEKAIRDAGYGVIWHGRDAGLRIDHLLLNPFIARHLRRAGVDRLVRGWEKTSDHAPTWIELEGSP